MWRYLYRRAQVQGLLGRSRSWRVVWAVLFGGRLLRRVAAPKPDVVYSEVLSPDQVLVISHEDAEVGGRASGTRGARRRR